jgi:hypothetical protein
VKGSVASGVTVAIGGRLRSGVIGGNLEGAALSVLGLLNPAKFGDAIAIGSLAIGGNVADSRILAGYDRAGAGANADASVGRISVGGDWQASDLSAGIAPGPDGFFGTDDDALIPGGNALLASIASVVIKRNVTGAEGGADHSGPRASPAADSSPCRLQSQRSSHPADSDELAGAHPPHSGNRQSPLMPERTVGNRAHPNTAARWSLPPPHCVTCIHPV